MRWVAILALLIPSAVFAGTFAPYKVTTQSGGFSANGVEDRCTDLGSDCYCSEPMNDSNAGATASPNSVVVYGWNPTDTQSASTKECTDLSGWFETAFLGSQAELFTTSIAAYDDSIPSHAANWTHALYQNGEGVGGDSAIWATINGHRPPSGASRVCARYYYTVSQDYGGVESFGNRNKMMEMTGEDPTAGDAAVYLQIQENNACAPGGGGWSGPAPKGAAGRAYCQIVGSIGIGPGEGNYSFTDGSGSMTYDDCMWAGGRGTCSLDSAYKCFNTSECSALGKGTCTNIPPASWCRVESCTVCPGSDLDTGGTCHFEIWHKVLATGREIKRTTPDAPMEHFGTFHNSNFFGGDWAHDVSQGDIIRSLWMVGKWATDSNQRIGCAEEIEGEGCHSSD